MSQTRRAAPAEVPGLALRRLAVDILDGVLRRQRALDEQLEDERSYPGLAALAERDRALLRKVTATALRRLGTLRHLLRAFLASGIPADAPRLETILLVGATQILWLDIPDHAAVDLAVRLAQADRRAGRYAGLVNAVLRRIARDGAAALAEADPTLDAPPWLLARWTAAYGAETARAIAAAHAQEPALDVSVKSDPERWATRLRGEVLPTGTVRTLSHGPVSRLPGYDEGAWWVQDAAAALPARLFGDLAGRRVADLCAAPGGKTAQLALAGGKVVAVDRAEGRLARLRQNLARLRLDAEVVAADVLHFQAEPFDAVLLDAPCSSTGTIRRHPDIPWRKSEAEIATLAGVQAALLDRAAALTRPGGTLVYCVCSLEPEEGERQVAALLARRGELRPRPILPHEISGLASLLTPAGELRSLPCQLPHADPRLAGLDGFYAARLERT